jgi:hypothetical protein
MTDRLALATRTCKARRASICTICRVPITIGQPIARLISPPGRCHLRCVPHVTHPCCDPHEVSPLWPVPGEVPLHP